MAPYRFLAVIVLFLSYTACAEADVEVVDRSIDPIKTAVAVKDWVQKNVVVTDGLTDPIIKAAEDETPLQGSWSADIKLPDDSSSYITAEGSGESWRLNGGYNIRRNEDNRIGISYLELPSDSGIYINFNLGREWARNGLYVRVESDTLVPTDSGSDSNYQIAHAAFSYTPLAADWMTMTAKAQIAAKVSGSTSAPVQMEIPYYNLDIDMTYQF